MSRVHKRKGASLEALAERSDLANRRNIAVVRTATRSVDTPKHGLMHKRQKRTPPGPGVGKPLHGDKRTSKTAASYQPTVDEAAFIRSANITAEQYRNIKHILMGV